jgi:hypothetical protein
LNKHAFCTLAKVLSKPFLKTTVYEHCCNFLVN